MTIIFGRINISRSKKQGFAFYMANVYLSLWESALLKQNTFQLKEEVLCPRIFYKGGDPTLVVVIELPTTSRRNQQNCYQQSRPSVGNRWLRRYIHHSKSLPLKNRLIGPKTNRLFRQEPNCMLFVIRPNVPIKNFLV